MNNWCSNTVEFSGSPGAIVKLATRLTSPIKVVRDSLLATISFDPPPWEYDEEFKSEVIPGGKAMARTVVGIDKLNTDPGDMIRRLGTKWDFDILDLKVEDTRILGRFHSATAPPVGWFKHICSQYWLNGNLSYGECLANFAGLIVVLDGEGVHYRSDYNTWAQLNEGGRALYLEKCQNIFADDPEMLKEIKDESKLWPLDWDLYKIRFYSHRILLDKNP